MCLARKASLLPPLIKVLDPISIEVEEKNPAIKEFPFSSIVIAPSLSGEATGLRKVWLSKLPE